MTPRPTLSLTEKDVHDLKTTVGTEWVPSAGDAQAHGIVDTILNRIASGHWGPTARNVVDSRKQFSNINGPKAWRHGHNSVDDIPASRISPEVHHVVDSYLDKRAAGGASSIGSHLNYANPNDSDRKNRPWINALDGPVLGSGKAIHRHGTVPELERYRPPPFAVALPGAGAADRGVAQGGQINGKEVADANGVGVKGPNVRINNLGSAMEPAIRAVAEVARWLRLPTPVITSGNDGGHMTRSLHYAGLALDFRGNNISVEQGKAFRNAVREILGEQYDVAFETFRKRRSNNHLHVEFDPPRRRARL